MKKRPERVQLIVQHISTCLDGKTPPCSFVQKRCHWRGHDYISYNRSLSKSIQVEGKRVILSHPQRGRVYNYVCPRAGQANTDVLRENGGQSSSCSLCARPIEVEQCHVSTSIQKRYRYRRTGPANPHDRNILPGHGDPAHLKPDREAFPVEQIAFPPAPDRPQSVRSLSNLYSPGTWPGSGLFSSQWRRGSWRMRLRSRAARQRAFRMFEPPAARIRL